jgi:hypothetical protein
MITPEATKAVEEYLDYEIVTLSQRILMYRLVT